MVEALIAAAGVSIAGVAEFVRHRRGDSGAIKQLVDLCKALPEDSESRDLLRRHIDDRVRRLIVAETHHTRDWSGASIAAVIFALGAYVMVLAWPRGGWWMVGIAIGAFLALLGLVGLGDRLPKKPRDASGRALTTDERGEETASRADID